MLKSAEILMNLWPGVPSDVCSRLNSASIIVHVMASLDLPVAQGNGMCKVKGVSSGERGSEPYCWLAERRAD